MRTNTSPNSATLSERPRQTNEFSNPEEFKTPPLSSLIVILVCNFLFNVSFYIIVPTVTGYADSLKADAIFGGLAIGCVTFASMLTLVPISRLYPHHYRPPLDIACLTLFVGHVLYALADYTQFLYLILIGRLVNGIGFTGWMFVKKYVTDGNLVGIRRRTLLSSFLVTTQAVGMVVGPLLGGFLSRMRWNSEVNPTVQRLFNQYTMPGWVMAVVWLLFWIAVRIFFKEAPPPSCSIDIVEKQSVDTEKEARELSFTTQKPNKYQYMCAALMCFLATTVFLELGAWESNVPLLGGEYFNWNEYNSGVFIGLIGLATFPFVFPLSFLAKRVQDRFTLVAGICIAMAGLIPQLVILSKERLTLVSYSACWFLVCWGFSLISTITLSLLSKILPDKYNTRTSVIIQYANYLGRLTGAVWGTAANKVVGGIITIYAVEILFPCIALIAIALLWPHLKAKTG
ncbi:MFS general substrate transporter [Basidiobolus meristosporus CBS 931.73]|uniref:MFS general substrate transporter n=1 Tax=Basidiobolus meristosporus CBS 931.73 TaxID=1314790 RepID=A0A1Y1YKF8_9FUNG|nr:MFS general substrate transporter [Basidiobolus meristosporus CBS 931.73]|eukprot:ORX98323.1 MFS general substrate transporter [Basidiobolus meristosporus CBS 931.73]